MINVIAQFKTILATGISKTATSGVLDSNSSSDNDGATIPNGDYGVVIDERNSSREYAIITVDGFNFTFVKRGLSVIDGITEKDANKFDHRKGAEIKIVSHPIIPLMTKTFNGLEPFGGIPLLPADRAFTDPRQVVDKEYADAIASAGIISMLVSAGTGLTININAGTYLLNGVVKNFSAVSGVSITDDATNYVQIKDGVLNINTSAFEDDIIPLAVVVAADGAITSITDKRSFYTGVDVKATGGLGRDSDGLFVKMSTVPGLEILEEGTGEDVEYGLQVKLKTSGGISKGEDGLFIDSSVKGTAGEALVAGNFAKIKYDSEGAKIFKALGFKDAYSETFSAGGNVVTPFNLLKISPTLYIITYRAQSGSSNTYFSCHRAARINSDGTVTFGAASQFHSADVDSSQFAQVNFAKRVSDNAGLISLRISGSYYSNSSPLIHLVKVNSDLSITLASSSFAGGGSNRDFIDCFDAINLSGNNWVFATSGDTIGSYDPQYAYTKLFAGQLDPSAGTITLGTETVLLSTANPDVRLCKLSSTQAFASVGGTYRVFDVNSTLNVITLTYAAQTSPVVGSSRNYRYTSDGNGLAVYLNASGYLAIARYSVSSGVMTLGTVSVLTSTTATISQVVETSEYRKEFVVEYVVSATSYYKKIFTEQTNLAVSNALSKEAFMSYGNSVHVINYDGSFGRITRSVTELGGIMDCYYDTENFIGPILENTAQGEVCSILLKGQILPSTDLIIGERYYLHKDFTISTSSTKTILSTSYTGTLLGIAISSTELLLI